MSEIHSCPSGISVALCTCNGEKFLREQLDSILGQTRSVDEIVICDDASTDSTVEIIRSFLPRAPIRLTINSQRLGVTENFARAISLCSGGIIFLADQDDRWQADKVATLAEVLADESIGLAFSNAGAVGENGQGAGYRLWESIWFDDAERRQMESGGAMDVLLRHAVAAGSTLAFKADYLPLILPIPDFPNSHDIWIALLIAGVARVRPVDRDLIDYRLHGANQVGMRRRGLLGQLEMARWQVRTDAFAYAADFHEAARTRLAGNGRWPVEAATLKLLDEKVRHSRIRHDLPGGLAKIGRIKAEWGNGNYRRYSYGFKSVLQDLFLR